MRIKSSSEADTAQIAAEFASKLKGGDVVLLSGTLGVGKSVFARALIRSICKDDELEVPSPTFTLVQTYEAPLGSISHYDLYRLENQEDIYEIGWEEALGFDLVLVEWPERLGEKIPEERYEIGISLDPKNETHRFIDIANKVTTK